MDLFFIASKVGWFFLTPSNLILLAMLVGVGLLYWKRARRIGWRIATGGAITIVVVTVIPIGDWLIASLERRFPPYVACKTVEKPVAGIILLGGAINTQKVGTKFFEDLGPGADRIRKAAQLAHEYPKLLVVVSGGQAFPREGARSEAVATADLLMEFGVDLKRQRLETGSRTTAENAKFVADQATGEGSWLLVTSAFHMPRSIGAFRKAGIDVTAVPTDWMVDDDRPILTLNALDRLGRLDLGVHEYIGLIAYWITGRSSGILPGPRKEDACPATPPPPPPATPPEEPAPSAPAGPPASAKPPAPVEQPTLNKPAAPARPSTTEQRVPAKPSAPAAQPALTPPAAPLRPSTTEQRTPAKPSAPSGG
jgi:uncharacterized SAM-binding protein YcdF (DUF218 family)